MTARPDTSSLADRLRLIVITDESLAHPRTLSEVVRHAVRAGCPAVQLRHKTADARRLAELGRELLTVVHEAGALFFVNDRLDVALAVGADGAHLGPDDVPLADARRVVPEGFLLGASADDPGEARRLVRDGADYIGCGAVFATSTKLDAGEVIGIDGLRRVVDAVDVPVVGIGGVDAERAARIRVEAGAAGVAVVSAVMAATDVGAAVRGLLEPWERSPGAGRIGSA